MILSMTGYASREIQLENKQLFFELRSLNSKTADITIRTPSFLADSEASYRKILSEKLFRGRISLTVKSTSETNSSQVLNPEVINSYLSQLTDINPICSIDTKMALAVRMPNAFLNEADVFSQENKDQITHQIHKLINDLAQNRIEEGCSLQESFKLQLSHIESLIEEIKNLAPNRETSIRDRISKLLSVNEITYDSNRFEQELLYYLEKIDFTEEINRLNSHISYFREIMKSNSPNGKKLGFISQEIGREINTLGAKAFDATIQHHVVRMKSELEKIKEQLINIL